MSRFGSPMIPDYEFSLEQWSDDERQRFMHDRERLLKKLLSDRQSWQDACERLGRRGTLKITWTDSDHAEQQTLLTGAVVAGHTTVLRAVAYDLILCGEEGVLMAERLFSDLYEDIRQLGEDLA
ncbi:MAG: hypothetical protein KC432_16165 [Thermomicrobiales bacterium]|nr:hypothetical protein [Thermomicrobiales bacterium]